MDLSDDRSAGRQRATDVIIAGGGPAGLAGAIAARLTGLSVTVVDRRRPPIDKACGEGILPDGVQRLDALGVRLPPQGHSRFHGVRYVDGSLDATGFLGGGHGVGVRRAVLHESMARRAEELGVRLWWGRTVQAIADGGARIDGEWVPARWVIVADGAGSRLRSSLGVPLRRWRRRFGLRRHYDRAPWSDLVEVFWSTDCEVYVTPVASDGLCIALVTDDRRLRLDDGLRRFPELGRRLAGHLPAGDDVGSSTALEMPRSVVQGHVALLGDASGSVDAITGAGVSLALHQAQALARALSRGDLRLYARDHRRLMRLPVRLGATMLAIKERPWLRRSTLGVLDRTPGLFSGLLRLHARHRGAGATPTA